MTQEQKDIIKKLLWDYNFTEEEYMDILTGKKELGSFNRKWAVRRAVEGLNYYELIELVGFKTIVEVWPSIRETFRIKSIRDGIDYALRKYTVSASR
ncbi:MAG: hypothetical protein CVV21_05700 [Candidatus Goldiibacteriota bacterium HGW-Goldbacteria-1]|jgi:hypothetical protein|nr:MAG: hypothetical protein CVV21_05700 [Candidatus Goldiibacteriota bacterium HGW-Goldbacteria-1]